MISVVNRTRDCESKDKMHVLLLCFGCVGVVLRQGWVMMDNGGFRNCTVHALGHERFRACGIDTVSTRYRHSSFPPVLNVTC